MDDNGDGRINGRKADSVVYSSGLLCTDWRIVAPLTNPNPPSPTLVAYIPCLFQSSYIASSEVHCRSR